MWFDRECIHQLMAVANADCQRIKITLCEIFIVIATTTPHPVAYGSKSHTGNYHQFDLLGATQHSLRARFLDAKRSHDLRGGVVDKKAHPLPLDTRHHDPLTQLQPTTDHPCSRRFVGQSTITGYNTSLSKRLKLLHISKNDTRSLLTCFVGKRSIALAHLSPNLVFIHFYTYF